MLVYHRPLSRFREDARSGDIDRIVLTEVQRALGGGCGGGGVVERGAWGGLHRGVSAFFAIAQSWIAGQLELATVWMVADQDAPVLVTALSWRRGKP